MGELVTFFLTRTRRKLEQKISFNPFTLRLRSGQALRYKFASQIHSGRTDYYGFLDQVIVLLQSTRVTLARTCVLLIPIRQLYKTPKLSATSFDKLRMSGFVTICWRIGISFLLCVTTITHTNAITLEEAVQHERVPVIQQLVADGQRVTPYICALASKRMAVAHYVFDYLKDQLKCEYRELPHTLERQEIYSCYNALVLHAPDIHFVRNLLLTGAHAEYRDDTHHTAYDYALQEDFPDKVRVLAHEDPQLYAQLLEQVRNKKLDEQWLNQNFHGINRLNINRPYAELSWQPVIIQAVTANDYETTKLLLNHGATYQQAALKMALRNGSKQLIQLLMRHGACVSAIDDALSLVTGYNPQANDIVPWLSSFYGQRIRGQLSTASNKALCPTGSATS